MKSLLGRLYTDPIAEKYRSSYLNGMEQHPDRGTCSFKAIEDEIYSVEELVAMQLSDAKRQAEAFAGEKIRDAVITVGPILLYFFSLNNR